MSVTITTTPTIVQMESTLQNVSISSDTHVVNVSNQFPENPIFNSITFDTAPVNIPIAIGTLFYDSEDNILAVRLPNGVVNQISEEVFFSVRNKSSETMLNGKLVYIDGELGNRSTVSYATNETCESAFRCIAMLTQDIEPQAVGKATFLGLVRGMNTHGLTGDYDLWLGTNGDYVIEKPPVGTARVKIGRVAKIHPTDGHILVFIQQDKYMFGDRDGGNYSLFDDNGYVEHHGDGRFTVDLNFDVLNSGGPPAFTPALVTIDGIDYREFSSANNQKCSGHKEFPHGTFLEGQTHYAHLHGFLKAGESAGTTGATYTLTWSLRQAGSKITGSADITLSSADLLANIDLIVKARASTGFTGPSVLGGQLGMTCARTGGNAGDVVVTTYGIHVACDAGGSRTETSK